MKIKIKNRIRRLRFDNNEMTQQELANAVGCTRQTINAIEGCKYLPSLEIAFKVSMVFSLPLNEIFFLDQENHSNISRDGSKSRATERNDGS